MPFFSPLVQNFDYYDIIKNSIWLLTGLIICCATWKLYFFYRKKTWLLSSIGTLLFCIGTLCGLAKEFFIIPKILVELFDDYSKLTGYILLTLGVISLTYNLIEMANTDPLTGINNRRFFLDVLYKEINRAKRDNTILSIVFIDVDRFKQINDMFGHLAGDNILKKIANKIKNTVRQIDITSRFGGDEFIILMPNTNLAEAQNVMKRVMNSIIDIKLSDNKGLKISFGISQYPKDGSNIDNLLSLASKRMYEDKPV